MKMKKIVIVSALCVSLFGGELSCNLYIDKVLEKASLLNFSIERRDLSDMGRYSMSKIIYLEKAIASCENTLKPESIEFLKQDRKDLLKMRKDFNLK
jgi:hypothetical protein